VLITDYWLVRDRELTLGDLYRTRGTYRYSGGWNWRAVVATLIGCGLAWCGPIVARLASLAGVAQSPRVASLLWFLYLLYDYAWFVGFGASAAAYFLLMNLSPPRGQPEIDQT
jgi:NCS1 family nucleobase:cation symporter-1